MKGHQCKGSQTSMDLATTSVISLPHQLGGSNSVADLPSVESPVAVARPLRIGQVELTSPAVQAALSGYSDWPMRTIARRMGASYSLAEVMLETFVRQQRRGRSRTAHHLRVSDDDFPVGGQLMGSDPEQFAPAARVLVEAGFHVIDINFGCPVKSAMGGCRGGYHLSQPEVALEIVSRVRDAVPTGIPVTLKMRRGIDETSESRDRFFAILDGAITRGVDAITVHGRTVVQKYNGPSRWEFLKEVKEHAGSHTIIGSGDLFSAEACLRMIDQTGVDGVSVARGAIGNPWIFTQFNALWSGLPLPLPPTVREQADVLQEHFALAAECYGKDRCLGQMKKFSIKYARLHPDHARVRDGLSWSDHRMTGMPSSNAGTRTIDPANTLRLMRLKSEILRPLSPLIDRQNLIWRSTPTR
ncbi:MAG: tRNA-dihydrouridine synthase [Planctomycetaceae bacterium]